MNWIRTMGIVALAMLTMAAVKADARVVEFNAPARGYAPGTTFEEAAEQGPIEVMVVYNTMALGLELAERKRAHGGLDAADLAFKRAELASLKNRAHAGLAGVERVNDFQNLRVGHARVANLQALEALKARPDVLEVVLHSYLETATATALIAHNHSSVINQSETGDGVNFAVFDTGWDTTHADVTGKVDDLVSFTGDNESVADDNGHGSGVGIIAAQTAPDARISFYDVFWVDATLCAGSAGNFCAPSSVISAAVDDLVTFGPGNDTVAVNLSLGAGWNTSACSDTFGLADLTDIDIQPIAATGNAGYVSSVYTDGIADPACSSEAIAVGAFYDAAVSGTLNWGSCSDTDPSQYQETCFSQSAPSLVDFVAAGYSVNGSHGTSVATPIVTGLYAVIRASGPPGVSTLAEYITQMKSNSIQTPSDTRSGSSRTYNRVSLLATLDDDDDLLVWSNDNCHEVYQESVYNTTTAAPGVCDTDTDGYGNACDGDFNQSNGTDATDFSTYFLPAFNSGNDSGAGEDMNCSGSVDATDYSTYFIPQFNGSGQPGPSGLSCAGTSPCP